MKHRPPSIARFTASAIALGFASMLLAVACGGAADEGLTDPAPTTAPSTSMVDESGDGSADGAEPVAGDDRADEEQLEEQAIEPVVFADDFATSIQPIFADRCASCHSTGGPGTAHWTLTDAESISVDHAALVSAVTSGAMPPWPAGGDSPPFHDDRSLRPDQIQAIVDWSNAGAPLDIAGDAVIEPLVPLVGLADPDLVVTAAEPYAGTTDTADDYRCQIYDPQLPDGGWITDYEFRPDKTEVVHHAIGYLLPAEARQDADEKDGADGKPGWECYGSSGLGEDDIFLGWAPGQNPTQYPDGTGLWVEPGGFVVVQIHYHYHHHQTEAPEDRSAFALSLADDSDNDTDRNALAPVTISEFAAPAEIPCSTNEEGPLCDRDAALAAAVERYGREGVQADNFLRFCRATVDDFAGMTDGKATSSCDIPVAFVGGTGEIISVLGHEHEIGDWLRITINPDTPDERVLLDIPDWDFDWQYKYHPKEQIVLDGDDVVRLECGWDRARRDPELEPAYVLWADGTNDEMCFATITTRPSP